jgi:hypothetical protein
MQCPELSGEKGLFRFSLVIILLSFAGPPIFPRKLSQGKLQETAPQKQQRTGRIDKPLDSDPIVEDLSNGAIFRFEIAPKLPLFTFKIIPHVGDDNSRFPQSTVQDIEVFKGDSDQALQHLTGCDFDGMEPPQRYGDWFHPDDVNFDGYQDIYLMTNWGATGNHYGCIWLYNPATGKFDYSKDFSQLSRYWLDPASKTIRTFDRSGGGDYVANEYKVENDRTILIWSANREWDRSKKQFHCVLQELRQGALVTTHNVWVYSDVPGPCYIPVTWFQPTKERNKE